MESSLWWCGLVLLLPKGQTSHSCSSWTTSSSQQLPSVYVMLVMFSSCRARELAVQPKKKKNPQGKGNECLQIAHRAAGHLLCAVLPMEKPVQTGAGSLVSCWDMTWFPCTFKTQKGTTEKSKSMLRTFLWDWDVCLWLPATRKLWEQGEILYTTSALEKHSIQFCIIIVLTPFLMGEIWQE